MPEPKYISATEMREQLGLSRDQAIYRIRRGDIKSQRVGRAWVIPVSELTRVPKTDWYKSSKQEAAAVG